MAFQCCLQQLSRACKCGHCLVGQNGDKRMGRLLAAKAFEDIRMQPLCGKNLGGHAMKCYCLVAAIVPCQGQPNVATALQQKLSRTFERPLPALTCVATPFENMRMGRSPCSNSLRRHLNAALCGKNLGAINACYCLVAAIPCQGHPNVGTA